MKVFSLCVISNSTSWPTRVASVESLTGLTCVDAGVWDFLLRNSFFLLAFLLCFEGLFFFTTALAFGAGDSWLPVCMEKLKVEPMVTERVKGWPWLASVWQRSRHLEAKELSLSIAVIFNSNLN